LRVSESRERFARMRLNSGNRQQEKVDLSQRRVAHAEARANVFRYQLDSGAIADRISLREVFHRLHQQPLPIYVSGIRGSFPAFITQLRRNCNRKNLSHE